MPKSLIKNLAIMTLITSMLFGCATTYHGDGIVIDKQKVYTQNHLKNGLKKGSSAAIAGGLLVGTVVSVGSVLLGAGAAEIPIVALATLGYGAASALTFGAGGIIVGAGTSYFLYSSKNMQQFKVKSLETGKIFLIEQYSSIPLNTKVKIIERNDRVFIKKQTK